jgi:hypothetical protein
VCVSVVGFFIYLLSDVFQLHAGTHLGRDGSMKLKRPTRRQTWGPKRRFWWYFDPNRAQVEPREEKSGTGGYTADVVRGLEKGFHSNRAGYRSLKGDRRGKKTPG